MDKTVQFNGDVSNIESNTNKVQEITENSNITQYPSAKAVKDALKKYLPLDAVAEVISNSANSIKNTASGSTIQVSDVSPVEHNLDVKVRSKNLILPHPQVGMNGITITIGDNGEYIFNGTSTGNSTLLFDLVDLPRENYIISLNNNVGVGTSNTPGEDSPYFAVRNTKQNWLTSGALIVANKTAVILSSNTGFDVGNIKDLLFCIPEGVTVNNFIIKPQLELGETATEYTPYISDFSAVEVKSKNLIPYPYPDTSNTNNGVTFTVNGDGSITANGTATGGMATFNLLLTAQNPALGETYTLSGCPAGGSDSTYRLRFLNGGISDTGSGNTFVLQHTSMLKIQVFEGTTVNNLIFKPQLERGSEQTAFEPYFEPYTKPLAVSRYGKNLLSVMSVYPTITPNANTIYLKAGQSYTFSFDTDYTEWRLIMRGTDINGIPFKKDEITNNTLERYITGMYTGAEGLLYHASNKTGNSWTFTCNVDCIISAIAFWNVASETEKTYSNYQLEFGSTPTEYEQYKEQTATANADGTVEGLTSVSPNMTLIADVDGIVIDCEYNVDTNTALKTLAEVQGLDPTIFATKEYVDKEIATFDFIKVVSGGLPQTGLPNKIYLVPNGHTESQDLFDEYVWVNNAFEFLGTKQFDMDLVDYYTKEEIDNVIVGKKTAEVGEIFNDYDNNIAGSRVFTVLEIASNADDGSGSGTYTLDSTEGLEVGDEFSVHVAQSDTGSLQCDNAGKITAINGNVVTVDRVFNNSTFSISAFKEWDSYLDEDGNDKEVNTFRIPAKPNVGTRSIGVYSNARGKNTKALSKGSSAEGKESVAAGSWSHAEGNNTYAAYSAHAEGSGTKAIGQNSHAEGQNTETTSFGAHAEGYNTKARAYNAHAEGSESYADGQSSHAEGSGTMATAKASHAEGQTSNALGNYSHTEGYFTLAQGNSAHSEGYTTIAVGDYSHSEGQSSNAEGKGAHAEGGGTRSVGTFAHTEGYKTVAKGSSSHAEGYSSRDKDAKGEYLYGALGAASHVEGNYTTAKGDYSHAEGWYSSTEGERAHAEGWASHAIGIGSHAEGKNCKAIGDYSHAGGNYTVAGNAAQTVVGRYNKNKEDTLFEVGNGEGTDEHQRSNAFEVYDDGHAEVQSSGSTPNSVVIKSELADYVIEEGSSGFWTYRKWASGIVECWGNTAEGTYSINSAYGSVYTTAGSISFPKGLFYNTPTVNVMFASTNENYGCVHVTICQVWNEAFDFFLIDSIQSTKPGFLSIQAKGRWKK